MHFSFDAEPLAIARDGFAVDQPGQEGRSSVVDLADLAPNRRKVIRLIMRSSEISCANLQTAVDALPEGERLTRVELIDVLKALLG